MSILPNRTPLLDTLYGAYLVSGNASRFIADVSSYYTIASLERLLVAGLRGSRRAAAMAISYLGDYRCNAILARALQDSDRAVRLLAEDGIVGLWCRDGTVVHQQQLHAIVRLNQASHFDQAARLASRLIRDADSFAEAWNQRAIAYFRLGRYSESLRDCRQAVGLNQYHFTAMIGKGHCHLEMADPMEALACFHESLVVNPNMENVRAQVEYLERALEEN